MFYKEFGCDNTTVTTSKVEEETEPVAIISEGQNEDEGQESDEVVLEESDDSQNDVENSDLKSNVTLEESPAPNPDVVNDTI